MIPLHLAAAIGHINKVNCLCDERANINIQDNDGVILNAGRLADWVSISLISRKVVNCCLQQFIGIQDPSNTFSYVHVAGSEENVNSPAETPSKVDTCISC